MTVIEKSDHEPLSVYPYGQHAIQSLLKIARNFIYAQQVSRMASALHSMPDWVLDEIGIIRSDIPVHAKRMIDEDN